jgi:hypothetical protein
MKRLTIGILVTLLLAVTAYFAFQWYGGLQQQAPTNSVTVQTIQPEKSKIAFDLSYAIQIEKDSLELHLDKIQMRLHMDSLRPYLESHEAIFHAKPISLITQKGYSDHCLAKVLDLLSMYQVKDYQLVKQ